MAASHQADALASGDEVVIAAGFPEDTPDGLGLLAHELTHVARARQARFVPPIAAQGRVHPQATEPATIGDEESMATTVEHLVRREARQSGVVSSFSQSPIVSDRSDVADDRNSTSITSPLLDETTTTQPSVQEDQDEWGGLPSPWEPMPSWLAPPPGDAGRSTSNESHSSSRGVHSAVEPLTANNSVAPVPSPVMAAPTSRSIDQTSTSTTHDDSSDQQQPGAIEPDLDALARQVYAVLKRRLAAERRRTG